MGIYIFDLLGTFAFAVSGALLGVKKDMDIYGCFVLASVTGAGGGTVRDLLLRTEPFIIRDSAYLGIIITAVLVVWLFTRFVERVNHPLIIADAIGLGVFTVIGATKGIEAGLEIHAVLILAILTATGGGMLRDVLANEVPVVLTREVYASASLAGAVLFYVLYTVRVPGVVNVLVSAALVFAIRMYTLKKDFHLPRRTV